MLAPVVRGVTAFVARQCWVANDPESVVWLGDREQPHAGVEAVWSRVEGLYRSGMHPGIQVCIRHRGEVVLDRAIGHARGNRPGRRLDPELAAPMTGDTPVNLFSAAKAVTAMTVLKLEEQGVLSLDDTVGRHVPEFARHGKESITIRHLLTHRAGVPSLPPEAFDLELLADHERILEHLCDLRPSGGPDGPPAYHAVTGGFILEGVVRRATGRSLRDVLATEIKVPLDLQWFDLGVSPEDTARVAWNVKTGVPLLPPLTCAVQRALGGGWDTVVDLSNDPRFLTGVIPSANVVVSARDAATFYQCLLDGGDAPGGRVFETETVARAITADRTAFEPDRMIGVPLRYGAGFMLGTEHISLYGWNHPRAFGHLGLSNSFTWADPDRDLVVAILTTGKPVLGPHLGSLFQLIGEIHKAFPVTR